MTHGKTKKDKKNYIYKGKNYKIKNNNIEKIKNKYSTTYQYILTNILQYKKYINKFDKIINKENSNNELLLKIIELTAKDFEIDNTKTYNCNRLNKKLIKKINKIKKDEKKKNIISNNKVVKLYKKIENKEYKELRELAFEKTKLFLEAIYLYTICED